MAQDDNTPCPEEMLEIDLRQPGVAAVWAWLWPGAGHLYQRRYAKGVLFMVCILSTYFWGLALGGGRVVYASWAENDRRWQYALQLGVGVPALPALVENRRLPASDREPRPNPLFGGYMVPPERPVDVDGMDQLAQWHNALASKFELGTLFTVVAGLLNVLAIYDAYAGPFLSTTDDESDDEDGEAMKKARDRAAQKGVRISGSVEA